MGSVIAARLSGALARPFTVRVRTTPGATVNVAVTLPDGAAGPVLALTDTDASGRFSAVFTPTVVGLHLLTVDAAGEDVDALTADLAVSALPIGLCGSIAEDPDCCDGSGINLAWPCPDLAALQCIESWSAAQIETWLDLSTRTLFEDLCRRFPGCENFARLRPRGSSCCLVRVGGTYGVDLFPTVRYPVLEIVDVEIDGASVGVTGWRIEKSRYLVPTGTTGWPSQDLSADDGGIGTWSILVRYGRPPPPLAVKARDRFMYSMLTANEPATASGSDVCRLPDGLLQIVENGRTMTFDPDTAAAVLFEEAKKRWPCRKSSRTGIFDPAESTAAGSSVVGVVSGDQSPAAVLAFAGSGCDIAALLASGWALDGGGAWGLDE